MSEDDKNSPWKVAHLGVEFTSGLFVGLGIGYLLDTWLGTMPWFMVMFVVLGTAAGLLNVYRSVIDTTEGKKNKEKDDD